MSDLFDNLDVDGSGIITRCLDAFFQLSLPKREREGELMICEVDSYIPCGMRGF